MSLSYEQARIQKSKVILDMIVDLRREVAEFRQEMQENFSEINMVFDRIDGHIDDISKILTTTATR